MESIQYDVVIIGAGPSGLACGIHLKQLNENLSVCVIEKGAEVGAHILSGAVFDHHALDALLPGWPSKQTPLKTKVTDDQFWYLSETSKYRLPTPPTLKNHHHFIISLGELCQFLASEAESLGVEIFPGFCGASLIIEDNRVLGIKTGDMGLGKDGNKTERYQEGMEVLATHTILAEGTRGSLSQEAIATFNLAKDACPQTYGIGIKEVWESKAALQDGQVLHTIGWPMDQQTYGGGFLYQYEEHKISVGYIIGLDYQNPYLDPFEEMQRFKTHPQISPFFKHAVRIGYGARAINEGGYQSLPQLEFPGGLLIGDAAGFLNVAQIKGSHNAIYSGMEAAKWLCHQSDKRHNISFDNQIKQTAFYQTLYRARNIRPGFKWGLIPGLINAAMDTYIFRGQAPWTLKHVPDHSQLKRFEKAQKIQYPMPDQKLTFDKLSSVALTNTMHEENQPSHLKLKNPSYAIDVNYQVFGSPETRYCPAAVYEVVEDEQGKPKFQINAQNCIHCKTCDIKDPKQNIKWTTPEGGGGPRYSHM